jgi:ADP-heptose:LPS heptosyltransferase
MGLGKQIEFVLKDATSALLRLWLAQPEKNPEPPYKRILFIRYGGIGDMILSLPVFRASKEKFNAVKIDVLCDRSNAAPILKTDWVDSISYYDKSPQKIIQLIYTLRKKNYDYVVNLIPYASFTFGLLARLIAPHAVRAAADQEEYSCST